MSVQDNPQRKPKAWPAKLVDGHGRGLGKPQRIMLATVRPEPAAKYHDHGRG